MTIGGMFHLNGIIMSSESMNSPCYPAYSIWKMAWDFAFAAIFDCLQRMFAGLPIPIKRWSNQVRENSTNYSFSGHNSPLTFSVVLLWSGRGVVCTGRVERGKIKKGDQVDILGYGNKLGKTAVTGKITVASNVTVTWEKLLNSEMSRISKTLKTHQKPTFPTAWTVQIHCMLASFGNDCCLDNFRVKMHHGFIV